MRRYPLEVTNRPKKTGRAGYLPATPPDKPCRQSLSPSTAFHGILGSASARSDPNRRAVRSFDGDRNQKDIACDTVHPGPALVAGRDSAGSARGGELRAVQEIVGTGCGPPAPRLCYRTVK